VRLLAEKIRRAGGTTSVVPLIRIAPPSDPGPLDAARREAREAKWIVFTSRHAVRSFLSGLAPPKGKRPRIAAVGEPTREEILRAGWPVDLVSVGSGAASLARDLARANNLCGSLVIHPRSSIAGEELASTLARAGAIVRSVEAYRTIPAELEEEERRTLRRGEYDLIYFASPSAVRRFEEIVPDAGKIWAGVEAVSIGPTTGAALREAGAIFVSEAARPDEEGVFGALCAAWQRRAEERGRRE
jgi:uroporphyrinogen-III synthase